MSNADKRQDLLNSLGDQKFTIPSTNEQVFAWGLGYYLLGLFVAPILLPFLPITESNTKILVWLLIPVPVGIIAWLILKDRDKGMEVSFDAQGFQIIQENRVVSELRWSAITAIRRVKKGLLVTRADGTTEEIRIPELKVTRETRTFFEVIRSYSSENEPAQIRKRWLVVSLPMLFIGIVGTVLVGRPAIMQRTYDGPIGTPQYVQVAFWTISVCFIMIGFIGMVLVGSTYAAKFETGKERQKGSRFGPNIQEHLDATKNWPKPITLIEGIKYRYIDPDGVRKVAKNQADGLWVFFGVAWFFPVIYFCALILGATVAQPRESLMQSYVACGILMGIGIIPLVLMPRFRKRQHYSEDEIWVSEGRLFVQRDNEIHDYPNNPEREMRDDYPPKEKRMPFGRVEKYGTKPDTYDLDRRYLMEIPKP